MGESGTAIEAVETKPRKTFTMQQLYKFAARYYLSKDWVKETLKYCGRPWLAEQLRHNDTDIEAEGLPRKIYVENTVEVALEELRYQSGLYYSGALWLSMDSDSEKRIHSRNRVLVLLQGEGSHYGVVFPPKTVLQTRKNEITGEEKMIPRVNTKKVEFTLHQWKKRGSFPRNVFFEGDDVRKEEGVPLRTPIGELCSRLCVNVEDLERTVSGLVLRTEEEWYPMKFRAPHFIIKGATPSDIRYRLLENEYGIDEQAKVKSA